MTSVAAQVAFHPTVVQSLKIGSTTLGRDKTYRAVQYFARFYAWLLLSQGQKDAAIRWNALKAHLGTARKLLRLGKPVEHLQAGLRALSASEPTPEKIATIGRQIGYFHFLLLDSLVWANSIKFFNPPPTLAKKLARTSNRFWLVGILCSILHSVLKISRLRREYVRLKPIHGAVEEKDLAAQAERDARLPLIKSGLASSYQQLITDSLDLWIPATALELTNLNDGVLGIFGLITSIMALKKQWIGLGSSK